MKPYAAGVSDEAPVCGQNGGLLVAAIVEDLLFAGAWGAANLRFPTGGAAYRMLLRSLVPAMQLLK